MASLIARFFIWLTLGWVIYEIILESNKLFALSVNPYWGIIAPLIIFICQEYEIRKEVIGKKSNAADEPIVLENRYFSIIIWLLVLCLLLGVVTMVWLGLIYKQAVQGLDLYD
jgi:hypothetical protein